MHSTLYTKVVLIIFRNWVAVSGVTYIIMKDKELLLSFNCPLLFIFLYYLR